MIFTSYTLQSDIGLHLTAPYLQHYSLTHSFMFQGSILLELKCLQLFPSEVVFRIVISYPNLILQRLTVEYVHDHRPL